MKIKQKIYLTILLTTLTHTAFTAESKNTLIQKPGYWDGSCTPTPDGSQRESWYQISQYIAEPLCTISNIPFFYVANAIKQKNPISAITLMAAGSASAISHMIPYKCLNDIDKIAAIFSAIAVGYESNCFSPLGLMNMVHNKKKLASILTLGIVYGSDLYCARSKEIVKKCNFNESKIIKRKSYHVWIHVLWHFLAAFTAYVFLMGH